MSSWMDEVLARPLAAPVALPARFQAAEYSQIQDSGLRQCVRDYCANFYTVAPNGIGCLFVGRARRWKTYAAAVIARTLSERAKIDVEFVQCAVTLNEMDRARFSTDTATRIKRLCATSVVVMDDFAQVPEKSFGAAVLMELAESRFSNNRPTIWTANLTAETEKDYLLTIANMYGAGFARRVMDGTEGYRVRVN